MIYIKDLMLLNPPFLTDYNTIDQARIISSHSKLKSIPVVKTNGELAGILDKNLIFENRMQLNSKVNNYINSEVTPLYSDDPLEILTKMTIPQDNFILPVINRNGRLVGVMPNPQFVQGIYGEIIESLSSVVVDGDGKLTKYGIIIIDDEGKIVCFNVNAENILGMKGTNIYGIHVNKVLHDSRLCEVVKKGEPHFKRRMQADQVVLCTNRFPLNKDNISVGAIGIFEDITELEKLGTSLRRLRGINLEMVGILESLDDGFIVMNNYGKVLRINSAFELITGSSANRILDSSIDQLVDWGFLPYPILSEVVIKKKSLQVIGKVKGRDFLFMANPVFGGDVKLNRVVVILKDVDSLNEIILNLQLTQELAARYFYDIKAGYDRIDNEDMIASSSAMKRVMSLSQKVAKVDSNVLITGETGVGKEVVARSIHNSSHRLAGPFIKLNCGAIPEQLLESELFGYEVGAFTGAKKDGKPGLIEMADGGSLFLDEIGDLPVSLQVKLLRVLQEHEVRRVGGTKTKKVDFRLIAATNRNLEEMVKQLTFREDLFYRLNVIPVFIPPLRERREDIVPLIVSFLNKFNKKCGLTKKISPEVIQSFLKYDWPGNIRELENTVERLIVTSDSNLIESINLTENTHLRTVDNKTSPKLMNGIVEETEKQLIRDTLQQCKTTREMADALGISQSAVVKKMKKYGITKAKIVN